MMGETVVRTTQVTHVHIKEDANPVDGDTITCGCGFAAQFVVLDDGKPGEWVTQ